jgi:copper chaperone NosL
VAERRRIALRAVLAAAALLAAGLFARAVLDARRPPEGPAPIAWDREVCAHCGMLISDPAFAAQLHTRDGQVMSFDDPGCLLSYEQMHAPDIHARWFHHHDGERWIAGARVAFRTVPRSPMGYGLAATDAGAAGALSLEQARERVLERARAASEARTR